MKGLAILIAVAALCLSFIALMDSSTSQSVDVKIINGNGAVCNSGAISLSSGRGACSHHGGVKRWLDEP